MDKSDNSNQSKSISKLMPESCLTYRQLVSHTDPSYQDPNIHQIQAMCRTELENISNQAPKRTMIETSIDGKVNIPYCPSMESSKLEEVMSLLRQDPLPDPFQIKDKLYPQSGLRMPLESKCHYSLLELSNTTKSISVGAPLLTSFTSPFDVRPQSGR